MFSTSILDWGLVLLYFAFLGAVWLRLIGRPSDATDYLVAGRRVTLPALVATLVSTWYGGILGVGEYSYRYGVANWVVFGVPYYVGALLFAWAFARKAREAALYTIPDLLDRSYGRGPALVGAIAVFVAAAPAAYVLMLGTLFSAMTSWPLVVCVIAAAVFSLFYIHRGGLRAVVVSDQVQFVLMYVGMAVILAFLFAQHGGLSFLQRSLPASHFTWNGGNPASAILVWYFIALSTLVDPGFWQRAYAARSPQVARRAVLWSVVFWILFDFMTTATGMYARAVLPRLADPVFAYPALARITLPPFALGLFYLGMIATVMSTVDSYGFIAGTTIGRDLIWRFRREVTEERVAGYSKLGLWIACAFATALALANHTVIGLWHDLGSLVTPVLLLPVAGALLGRFRLGARATVAAMVAPFVVSLVWLMTRKHLAAGDRYPLGLEPIYAGLATSLLVYAIGWALRRAVSRATVKRPGGEALRRALVLVTALAGIASLASRGFAAAEPDTAARDSVYLLPPVLVTATQARARETPATFSNLERRDIALRYSMQDVPVLLAELPSITTYSENGNGIGYNYITLRGFDQRRISVMINGVPQNDPEDHNVYWIDFPDLLASTENVQVQRGAGSAFYGPPAIGGSVNLVSNPFQARPGLRLESQFGFQEFGDSTKHVPLASRRLNASFNSGPVADRYMFYGKLGRILSDGYRQNAYVRLDSYFFAALRRDRNMTTRIHFFGGPIEDGLAYFGLPKFVNGDRVLRRQNLADWGLDSTGAAYSYAVPRRTQEIEQFSQPHYELLHTWQPRPGTTIFNTFFYYTGDGYFDYDASWADTSMLRIGSAYGIPADRNPSNALVRAFVGNQQGGWLPRVELAHPRGSLTLGGELRIHRSTHWGRIQFAGDLPATLPPDYHFYEYNGEKDIASVYAHELLRASDRVTWMGDVQVVRDRYGIAHEKFLANDFSLPYVFVNPRLGLNFNVSPALNTYAALAYTSREPRLRNLYAAEDSYFGATPQFEADTTGGTVRFDFGRPLAKPEHLLDGEIGARWGTDRWSGGISAFWMEFTDELIKSGQVDIFGQPVTGNASRSRHAGVELDGELRPARGLTIAGNLALSRNRLVRYDVLDDSGALVSLDGNPIAGFPDVVGNLRLSWQGGPWTASFLTRYVGAFPTDNFDDPANRNDAYSVSDFTLLHSGLELGGAALDFRGEVRNVFDRLYFASGEGPAFFPAAERNWVIGLSLGL